MTAATRRLAAVSIVGLLLAIGCSSTSANSLTGSESQVYDLTFSSVVIVLQGTDVSIKYEASNDDPAILVVNTAEIVNVANSTIDLTQLVVGQPRGVLENVNGGGDGVTNELTIMRGTVVFDDIPAVGKNLSGQFNATLSDGYTLNGTFSDTVNAP
jgi:hypothetical protein